MTATVSAEVSRHVAAHPQILSTSSESGFGIPELRAEMELEAIEALLK